MLPRGFGTGCVNVGRVWKADSSFLRGGGKFGMVCFYLKQSHDYRSWLQTAT